MPTPLDASRIIDGTYGYLYLNGVWQSQINHLEAFEDAQKKEIPLCGNEYVAHKRGPIKGSGTMSGFKVTSDLLKLGFGRFEIITKLDDPEAYGHETIRLKNCMVDRRVLANWTAHEEVTEEVPFTFEGSELLDPINQT